MGMRFDRRIQALTFKDLDKRQVHIQVVVQPRRLLHRLSDITVIPDNRLVVVDHCPFETEFCRTAEGDADNLAPQPPLILSWSAALVIFTSSGNVALFSCAGCWQAQRPTSRSGVRTFLII